jgi:tetratricopeptide (TPR) repeat protein
MNDYDAALRVRPDFQPALVNRAGLHRANGDAAASLADLERALEIEPTNAEARYNRAMAREMAGDVPAALADLDRLIADHPDHGRALLARAVLGRSRGTAAMQADLEAAVRVAAPPPEAFGVLAQVRAAAGDWAGAAEAGREFLRRLPRSPQAAAVRSVVAKAEAKLAGR